MSKDRKGKKLLAALLAVAVLLCSFPAVYAEEEIWEDIPEEVTVEEQETPEEVTLPEPEPEPEPEPAPAPVPAPVPEPEPAPVVVEIEPAAEPEFIAIPEDEPEAGSEPEDDEESIEDEEYGDEFFEFDEDDAGFVSDDLLSQFNNPETYEMVEFSGTADIILKDDVIYYDHDVTLAAKVSGVDMSYRLVWEANDGDERGWYTIGGGPEYTFTVTRDIVDREYRVILFAVD